MSSSNESMDLYFNGTTSDNSFSFQFTWQNCFFISLASLMSLTTVLANVTLIILVCVDMRLRRNSNYYIISLACADLLVGIFVIPMFSVYTILGRWPLGPFVCELWIVVDFTCVSASVFTICMISLNRYWAITQPVKYFQRQRKQRALLFVGFIWTMAVLSWVPAVLVHRFVVGSFAIGSACLYLPGFIYVLLSNTIIYFIPMGSMVYLYFKMLYALKQNLLKFQSSQDPQIRPSQPCYKNMPCCCFQETVVPESIPVGETNLTISTISLKVTSKSIEDAIKMNDLHVTEDGETCRQVTNGNTKEISQFQSPQEAQLADSHSKIISHSSECFRAKRVHLRNLEKLRLHQRRARTLGIIVVAFIGCWISFVTLFPINSYCNCIPLRLYDMSYWLAYLNSTLNPFLYGFNKDFRKAFKRLMFSSK
nr:muscarinic acetylcholine receptor M3-like [Lytechinus pictus]